MESIRQDGFYINADDPTVLTRLLALEEFTVTALERVTWQHRVPR